MNEKYVRKMKDILDWYTLDKKDRRDLERELLDLMEEIRDGVLSDAGAKDGSQYAAPARNCDVGDADGQYYRFCQWCLGNKDFSCVPSMCRRCYAGWSQMPYRKGQ